VFHQKQLSHPVALGATYNLFRNRQRPDLLCAVPECTPVPRFLVNEEWSFENPLRDTQATPPGFNAKAANEGARLNGFYLFQMIPRHRTAVRHNARE
jgi:hypothetical protein